MRPVWLLEEEDRVTDAHHDIVYQTHGTGSPSVVRTTLEALGTIPGLRLARPGEFIRRAFEVARQLCPGSV